MWGGPPPASSVAHARALFCQISAPRARAPAFILGRAAPDPLTLTLFNADPRVQNDTVAAPSVFDPNHFCLPRRAPSAPRTSTSGRSYGQGSHGRSPGSAAESPPNDPGTPKLTTATFNAAAAIDPGVDPGSDRWPTITVLTLK